jgi:hypothetical protein
MNRKTHVLYFSLTVMKKLQVGDLTEEKSNNNKRIKRRAAKRDKQAHLGRARLVLTVHFPEQPIWWFLACPMFLHLTRHPSRETIEP